jgi:hypothetical protein
VGEKRRRRAQPGLVWAIPVASFSRVVLRSILLTSIVLEKRFQNFVLSRLLLHQVIRQFHQLFSLGESYFTREPEENHFLLNVHHLAELNNQGEDGIRFCELA